MKIKNEITDLKEKNNPIQLNDFLLPKEAARMLRITPISFKKMCESGKIKGSKKIAGIWRVTAFNLLSYVNSTTT